MLSLLGGLLTIDTEDEITQTNAQDWLNTRILLIASLRNKLKGTSKKLWDKVLVQIANDAHDELSQVGARNATETVENARVEMLAAVDTAIKQTVAQYRNATANTALWVLAGALGFITALRQEASIVADRGIVGRVNSDGRGDSISYTIETIVENTVNRTKNETVVESIGSDYVEVSAHYGARPEHALWQGKVYKLIGSAPGYPNLVDATGYGTGPGLGGWNCRHTMWPFHPGIDVPKAPEIDQRLNARVYEIQQKINYHRRNAAKLQNRITVATAQSDPEMVAKYTGLKRVHTDKIAQLQQELHRLGVQLQ
jgi:hypothetical protein